jgi:hypothetical protein
MLKMKANNMSVITFVKGNGKVFAVQDMKVNERVEADSRCVNLGSMW